MGVFMPDGELNFAPDREDFPEGNPCGKIRLQELAAARNDAKRLNDKIDGARTRVEQLLARLPE